MAKTKLCGVCLGNPPTGSCIICGKRFGKAGKDNRWLERNKWLTELSIKLRKFHQKSTGDPGLDLEIARVIGPWRADQVFTRGLNGLYCMISYPCSFERRLAVGQSFDSLSAAEQKEIKENFIMIQDHSEFKWARIRPVPT